MHFYILQFPSLIANLVQAPSARNVSKMSKAMENHQHVNIVTLLLLSLVTNVNDAQTLKLSMDPQLHVNNVNRSVHLTEKMMTRR